MVAVCLVVFSACVVVVGLGRSTPLVAAAMLVGGLFWIVAAVNHNVSVQLSSPDWLRGRTISFYLLTFQGSLAIGSWISGWLASRIGIGSTVAICGILCACGVFLIPWFPLKRAGAEVETKSGS
jgi:predicted MFS family arabinose efflux permease